MASASPPGSSLASPSLGRTPWVTYPHPMGLGAGSTGLFSTIWVWQVPKDTVCPLPLSLLRRPVAPQDHWVQGSLLGFCPTCRVIGLSPAQHIVMNRFSSAPLCVSSLLLSCYY